LGKFLKGITKMKIKILWVKTQKDYILEYISRIDVLLEASLSREARSKAEERCRHCSHNNWAVWRCRDCSMGVSMCRSCIRKHHSEDPFHRIEKWNGNYFRPAELSEVGSYLLIRHHIGNPLCNSLKKRQDFLEMSEEILDNAEQEQLIRISAQSQPHSSRSHPELHPEYSDSAFNWDFTPTNLDQSDFDADLDKGDGGDEEFFRYLNDLRNGAVDNSEEGDVDVDDDIEEDETVPPIPKHSLPDEFDAEFDAEFQHGGRSTGHAMGKYVRVIHTNGIHNIAMIGCECQGLETLSSDLIASRLLPASFQRIQTLFSAQLLDHFRLCNLELKATAYQFYHLLQRLTDPLNPSDVLNLYNEFRRMSRIWRWMKRLKWAGYGNGYSKVADIKAGELTIFCPACPQPNINIPENWKEDSARYMFIILTILH
jgi:hypothetical protein